MEELYTTDKKKMGMAGIDESIENNTNMKEPIGDGAAYPGDDVSLAGSFYIIWDQKRSMIVSFDF